MNSEISVIVPIYNVENYLDRCIKSILNQTFENFELILINDGSLDSSLDICNKYGMYDKRIKIINQNNKGVSCSRNIGIENANGKYLLFVDADDYIDYDMLECLYNMTKTYDVDISICRCKLFIDGKLQNKQIITENIEIFKENKKIIENFMKENKFLFSPCNKLYKKSIIIENEIRFPLNIRYSEDAIFNYKVFLNVKKVAFTNIQKYNYYINNSSSITKLDESRLDILIGMEEIHKMIELYYPELKYIISNTYVTSTLGIIRDLAKSNEILIKYNILKNIKFLINKNNYITNSCKDLETKNRVLYLLAKKSPLLVATIYKVSFLKMWRNYK